jgi:hypothetical protein
MGIISVGTERHCCCLGLKNKVEGTCTFVFLVTDPLCIVVCVHYPAGGAIGFPTTLVRLGLNSAWLTQIVRDTGTGSGVC